MIEKIRSNIKKEGEAIRYQATAELPTLRERPVSPDNLPEQLVDVIDMLRMTQGPFEFFNNDDRTTNLILQDADSSVFLAVSILLGDNTIDGLATDTESHTARFYSNQLPEESIMEVSLLAEGVESAATLEPRLDAIKEFSLNRCFLSVYSQANLSGDALRIWKELESQGKVKARLMPSGSTQYLVL